MFKLLAFAIGGLIYAFYAFMSFLLIVTEHGGIKDWIILGIPAIAFIAIMIAFPMSGERHDRQMRELRKSHPDDFLP